ncbi:MAG: sigma factor-like helix-turn-helix DNA-binding protein [Methanobacteriaceae archaeon]|nr:sigma factor-like helix-turn-helix DNA-binding protein [Methanobacteriaceae archaeon]
MNTKERLKYIELFDYYSSLLTKHQIQILNDYLFEDFSMVEIASNYKVSKSAVSDIINRSLKQLNLYDSKLKLSTKISKIKKELIKDNKSIEKLDKIIRG